MVPIGSSTSFLTDAAPSKHSSAPNSLADPMSISISETSALPLQLQIESQARGKWKLAYLPATGPSLDFYYLNYRPTYRAGESIIDFWMLTPKGTPAPMTGSLELYDEFGKIRLAVLVPEGTKIPQNIANKNEPFLWKSWTIPKTLKAEFDFSEKFRVILKTSTNTKNGKRADPESELLVKGNNRHVLVADNADTMIFSSDAVVATAQDRQFRIKGLKASPGGKPNPAKLYVNSVASVATNKKKYNNSKSKIDNSSGSKSSEYRSNSNPSTKTTSPLLAGYRGKIKQSSSLSSANSYIMQSKALVTMAAIFIAGCIAL
ncbi:hypothetical protein BGZ46_008694 [Entomortierella lignicola]|nr:hypothetical protein BGZ46_008694 [Entomortierella lignicola]